MDAFQGCYRTHPRDLRCFSAFYLLLRVLLLAQATLFPTYLLYFTSGILSFIGAGVIAMFQPYKVKAHNTIDTVLLLLMGVYFTSYYAMILLTSLNYSFHWVIAAICEGVSIFLITLYLIVLLLWKLLRVKLVVLASKAKSVFTSKKCININGCDNEPLLDGRQMPTYD
jgi:hypothetical protein